MGWDESVLPFFTLRREFNKGYLLQAAWLLRNIFTREDFFFVILLCCQ